MRYSINDLLGLVPSGETRHFPAVCPDDCTNAFVAVQFDFKYGPPLSWNNRPPFEKLPWMGSRGKSRIGLDQLEAPDLTFARTTERLVDFYSTGTAAYVISQRLLNIVEALDPGSLEVLPVSIVARNSAAPACMVMPKRVLSAVDRAKTSVTVRDEPFGHGYVRKVEFPDGAAFDAERLRDVYSFADVDILDKWIWSRELVDQARSGAVRGLYTSKPGLVAGRIDSL